jgi:hypothetical protein
MKSGDSELIASVCAHAKQLAHDKGLCHAIIVLSSSSAIAALPDDPGGRHETVLVFCRFVELPTSKYTFPPRLFAAKIRESDEANATFGVDLVARKVR